MSNRPPTATRTRRPAGRVLVVLAALAVLVLVAGLLLAARLPGRSTPAAGPRHQLAGASAAGPVPTLVPPLGALDPAAPVPDGALLGAALAKPLADPALSGTVGIQVRDALTGQVLLDHAGGTAGTPASTAKLLTAAAALTVLGPDSRLQTRVYSSGGKLFLVGAGDPTLSGGVSTLGYPKPALLSQLARQVRAAGVRGTPAVVGDGSLFSGPALAPGWRPSYLTGEIAPVSGLTVDEGRPTGSVAPATRAANPSLSAAKAFRTALAGAKVSVGTAGTGRLPAGARLVTGVDSAPVSVLVQRMLTYSDNDIAEAFGRLVAIRLGQPATFTGAAAALSMALRRLGLDPAGLRMFDTSGLSHDDAVPPALLVDVLRRATMPGQQVLAPVLAGLPVAAFTGTLSGRYRSADSRSGVGAVRAKTGRISGVAALAGLVVTRDGRLLVFAAHSGSPGLGTGDAAMDRIAATIASCGCRR